MNMRREATLWSVVVTAAIALGLVVVWAAIALAFRRPELAPLYFSAAPYRQDDYSAESVNAARLNPLDPALVQEVMRDDQARATPDVNHPTPVDLPSQTAVPRKPTSTSRSAPTHTPLRALTNTSIPAPTNTSLPAPTSTSRPAPTNTSRPAPTNTSLPAPTSTSRPAPTNTSMPAPTSTHLPPPTKEPRPTRIPWPTRIPKPTATPRHHRPTPIRQGWEGEFVSHSSIRQAQAGSAFLRSRLWQII